MKKLVMVDYNKLDLLEAPIPHAGEEEAVVRVRYAGICGSDMHIIAGQHPTAKPPFVMGHEMCGELYEINSKRRNDLKPGDKVTVHAVNGCGCCEMCRSGHENLCRHISIMGAGCDGFYSEYVLCRGDRVIKFNDDVDMKIAAVVEPLTIAVHDVRRSGLRAGEDVFIAGAGTIGILIGLMCKLTGASNVVISEINPDRIAIAEKMGFQVVNSASADLEEQCIAITDGNRFDKVFEVTGFQGGFDVCLKMIKQGGTMVQVGMPASGKFEGGFHVNSIIFNEATYMGVRNSTSSSMIAAAKIINDGILNDPLSRIVSATYPKEKALSAFEAARADKSLLKILIDFS